jgi:hypothetical protein
MIESSSLRVFAIEQVRPSSATSAQRGASPAAGYTSKSLHIRHLNRKRFAG